MHCLKCHSQRVVEGSFMYPGKDSPVFEPKGLRFLAWTFAHGTRLRRDGFACLDCGLVWGSTDAGKLREFVRKHCDQRTEEQKP